MWFYCQNDSCKHEWLDIEAEMFHDEDEYESDICGEEECPKCSSIAISHSQVLREDFVNF